ncbi:MAG: arylesterase, partial [Brachymonas sp.]|nr:arylesterase [Brachymonas sp.]
MPPSPTTTRRSLLLTAFGLAATLALAPLLGACSKKSPRLQSLPAGATVLAFGDSVTYGTGAQAGQDWPSLLAGLSGWNVINAGIAGDTAAEGKNRLPELLASHSPA